MVTEEDIEILEKEIEDIEVQLSDPDIYSNVEKLSEVNNRYESLHKKLVEKNNSWEKIVLELEDFE